MCPLYVCLSSPDVLPGERTGWLDYFNLSVNQGYDRIFIETVTTTCKIYNKVIKIVWSSAAQCNVSTVAWLGEIDWKLSWPATIWLPSQCSDISQISTQSLIYKHWIYTSSSLFCRVAWCGGTCLWGRRWGGGGHWLSKETNSWSQHNPLHWILSCQPSEMRQSILIPNYP